ncbi:hypothetical protein ABBQ38_013234 [Trebouxia sp. C0009 RCD-2024]
MPLLEAVAEQIRKPESADAKPAEPGPGTAALAALAAGHGPAAATDAESGASPAGIGPAKKKKKRKAESGIPTVPVSKHKKRRGSKATPSSNDPADAAATSGNGDLPYQLAQEVKDVSDRALSGANVTPEADLTREMACAQGQAKCADTEQAVLQAADAKGSPKVAAADEDKPLLTQPSKQAFKCSTGTATVAEGAKSEVPKDNCGRADNLQQAAEKVAAKGKAVDPYAGKGTSALQQPLSALSAKSKQGQPDTKPIVASLVAGVGAPKEASATAGTGALAGTPTQGLDQAATEANTLADTPAAGASEPGTAAEVSSVAQLVEPVTPAAPPADADIRATAAGAHDSPADLVAPPARKSKKRRAVKRRSKRKSRNRAAGQSEAATGGTAEEHGMGPPSAADGPPDEAKATAAAEQPKSLVPAEPMDSEPAEPGPETAALASLAAGHGPATATDADALPSDMAAAKKEKRNEEKASDRATAGLQAQLVEDLQAEDPQSSAAFVTKPKKKRKANKTKPSNSVPPHDAAATPDNQGLVVPQAHELKQDARADPASGHDLSAGAGSGGGPSAGVADGQQLLPTTGKGLTSHPGSHGAAAAEVDKGRAQHSMSQAAAKATEKAAVKGQATDLIAKGTPAPKQSLPTKGTKPIAAAPAPASANAAVGAASAADSPRAHLEACKSQTVMARFARGSGDVSPCSQSQLAQAAEQATGQVPASGPARHCSPADPPGTSTRPLAPERPPAEPSSKESAQQPPAAVVDDNPGGAPATDALPPASAATPADSSSSEDISGSSFEPVSYESDYVNSGVEDADSGRLRAQSLESPAPPNPGTGSRNTDSSDSSDSGSSDSGSGDSGSSDSGSRDSESSESESSDDSEDAAAGAKAEQVCSEAEAGGGSARGARGGGPDGDTESDDSFKPAARATARKSKMLMVVEDGE